jgi:hypothetical protein
MNKGPIFWLLVALGVIATVEGVRFVTNAVEGRRYFITIATASVGHELIGVTNTPHWVRVGPGLRAELSDLLAAPTHINKVILGDDRPPTGDGHASSRLILTNELGRSVSLRLRLQHDSGQKPVFDILTYSRITNMSMQPILR